MHGSSSFAVFSSPKAWPRHKSASQLLAISAAGGNTEQVWAMTPALLRSHG